MTEADPSLAAVSPPPGWRRRHPVLARVVLYTAGALLVASAVWLVQQRGETDRQDHLEYLRARLDGIDLVLANDVAGKEVLALLDEEFRGPDLPRDLRARVLRVRAFALLKGERTEEALEALAAAAPLAADDAERYAIGLERAQALLQAERADAALAVLEAEPPEGSPALAIWRGLTRSQALASFGKGDEAQRSLDEVLEALPRPLPVEPIVTVGLSPWSPADAALFATGALADLAFLDAGPRPWVRLLELVPDDMRVCTQAARRLLQGGHEAEARAAWAHARALDPERAAEIEARHVDLQRLSPKK